MKIALFADRFPELSESFVSGEVLELGRQGAEVSVYSNRPATVDPDWPTDQPTYQLESGLGRDPRRLSPLATLALQRPDAVWRDLSDRKQWREGERVPPLRRLAPTIRHLERHDIEHIHVHFAAEAALDALRIKRLTGIPYSITAHAYELFESPANLRVKFEEAAFVTVPCAYNMMRLRQFNVRNDHIHVRMLGTDTRRVRRRTRHPAAGPILAVGRLVEKKGFHVLIHAAARHDLGHIVIVGDGPWRSRLQGLIDDHGLVDRVTLAGRATHEQVRTWMEEAVMLVAPSVVAANGDQDALPVVLWEALAMELPLVGTSVAGLPEVIRPPWGVTVAPNSADSLAHAIRSVSEASAADRAAAGRAGRAWLEANFRQELAAERLLTLVSEHLP